MDKLKNMSIFLAIVDQGSLSGAAETLQCSVATITRSLAELEDYLGVRLLQRSTRRLGLTEEGREYQQHCRHILAEIQAVESQLDNRKVIPTGKLRVTAPVMFGRMHLGPLLYRWLADNEQVSAELLLLDRPVDLLDEGIDLALRISNLDDSSMVALPIGQVTKICCASPLLIERLGEPEQPGELAQWPTIAFAPDGHVWRFAKGAREQKVKTSPVLTCNQIDPMLDAARCGLGVVSVLSYQAAPLLESGELIEVLADYVTGSTQVQFVIPSGRLLSLRVRGFMDWALPLLRGTLERKTVK